MTNRNKRPPKNASPELLYYYKNRKKILFRHKLIYESIAKVHHKKPLLYSIGRISKREMEGWEDLLGLLYYIWVQCERDVTNLREPQREAIVRCLETKRSRRGQF